MIKRMLATFLIASLCVLGSPGTASAHVLKVDGTIGGILHIKPDDNPTTDKPTNYVMSFDDNTGKFSLPKCTCTVSIVLDGKVIASKPLVISNKAVSENRYTFATAGVYDLRFTGTPKTSGAFQSFKLDYTVRITNGRTNAQPMPVTLWIGMGMVMGLILLAAYAMDYDTSKRKRT